MGLSRAGVQFRARCTRRRRCDRNRCVCRCCGHLFVGRWAETRGNGSGPHVGTPGRFWSGGSAGAHRERGTDESLLLVSGARVRRRRAPRSPTPLPRRFVPPQRSCRLPSQGENQWEVEDLAIDARNIKEGGSQGQSAQPCQRRKNGAASVGGFGAAFGDLCGGAGRTIGQLAAVPRQSPAPDAAASCRRHDGRTPLWLSPLARPRVLATRRASALATRSAVITKSRSPGESPIGLTPVDAQHRWASELYQHNRLIVRNASATKRSRHYAANFRFT
jgi:hypothetical protein